jgi:two-component system cell cycle response regulator
MKILIAEDDVTSRTILQSVTQKWDYDPIPADNGKKAWQAMQGEEAPRLAIIDWQMPEMDGVTLCRKIRAVETTDPPYLIMLTSKDDKKDIVNALDAGANDFLSKPYNTEELRARLNVGRRMLDLQTDLKRAYKALEFEARHDPLTGLYNRKAILDILQHLMEQAQSSGSSLWLCMCDLDFFKRVNDTFGHLAGDEVLRSFAALVRSIAGDENPIGRYGGEEFLIIFSGSIEKDVLQKFEYLRKKVADSRVLFEGEQIEITVSIGITRLLKNDLIDILLARADDALYRAKSAGRNCIICNNPG